MQADLPLPAAAGDPHRAAADRLIARVRAAATLPELFEIIDDPGIRQWRSGRARTDKDLATEVSDAVRGRYQELQAAMREASHAG